MESSIPSALRGQVHFGVPLSPLVGLAVNILNSELFGPSEPQNEAETLLAAFRQAFVMPAAHGFWARISALCGILLLRIGYIHRYSDWLLLGQGPSLNEI